MAKTDAAGNLVLHVGDGKRDEKTPRIAFVAHMDEIGYEVKKIEDDGRLQVEVLGGGYLQYFLGHVVLVHSEERTCRAECWNYRAVGTSRDLSGRAGRDRWMSRRMYMSERIRRKRRRSWGLRRATT